MQVLILSYVFWHWNCKLFRDRKLSHCLTGLASHRLPWLNRCAFSWILNFYDEAWCQSKCGSQIHLVLVLSALTALPHHYQGFRMVVVVPTDKRISLGLGTTACLLKLQPSLQPDCTKSELFWQQYLKFALISTQARYNQIHKSQHMMELHIYCSLNIGVVNMTLLVVLGIIVL